MPGLSNTSGNDCWVNSLMQLIATVPSLQHMISDINRIYLNNRPTASLKQAVITLKREIVKLSDDRVARRSISQANSGEFRKALQTLIPFLSESDQEDVSEPLLALAELHEILLKQENEFTGHEPGFFSLVTTRHYTPEAHTKPLEPKTLDLSVHLTTKEDQTQKRKEYIPGSDRSIPFGFSIEDRKIITKRFPNNKFAFPTLTANTSPFHQYERIVILELVKFERMFRSLHVSRSSLTAQELSKYKAETFIHFIQHYFIQKADPATESSFYYNPTLNALQAHKLEKITRTLQESPEELLFLVQRFINGSKLKHQHGSTRTEIKIPFFEQFTLPAEYVHSETSFELDSFIVHIGEISSGHYISYQKIQQKWFCCNDDHVTECSSEEALKTAEEAYLLHYKKLSNMTPDALSIPYLEVANSYLRMDNLDFSSAQTDESRSKAGLDCLNFTSSKILETEQKSDEFYRLEIWHKNFKDGSMDLSQLPDKIFNNLCLIIWIRDGMPSKYNYGKNKILSNPQTLIDDCEFLLYPEGNNLLDQFFLKEREFFEIEEAESTLAQIQSFINAFSKANTSKTILLRIFYELPEKTQTEIIHEIAKTLGKNYAEKRFKEKNGSSQIDIEKNILKLKRVYDNRSDIELLFPGEGINFIQAEDQSMQGIQEIVSLIQASSIDKKAYLSIFQHQISPLIQNKLIHLIFKEEIASKAIEYANLSIVNNIGILSVKPRNAFSILEKINEKHIKNLKNLKILAQEKRVRFKALISDSETLTLKQKEKILKTNFFDNK